MAPKSKVLKLVTVVAFICLFILILMNIFNSGHSYYYSKVERKRLNGGHQSEFLKSPKDVLDEFWLNNGDDHYNGDLLQGYNNKEPSTKELIEQFEQQLPNVPFAYSYRHENLTMEKFKNCAAYPAIQILNFYNNYWQTYNTRNVTFQLYGAYYDEREAVADGPVLRILAMVNQITAPFPTSYCQLWFENDVKPQITAIKTYKPIWLTGWGAVAGAYYPYLMTCDIPKAANITGERLPKAVTIVEHQCDTARNSLKVIYDKPKHNEQKLPFAVCVKGLDFPYADISQRLVEWLEMMRLLGASKVYFHHLATHPNVTKVLSYYQQQGFIELQPLSLVGGVVALPKLEHWLLNTYKLNKRLNEVMPYNDCFYRHMYKYDYIAVLDIDEVIMPLGKLTKWKGLVDTAKQYAQAQSCHHGYAGICVPNVYFPHNPQSFSPNSSLAAETAPAHMFMLNHQYRVKNYLPQGYNIKCLHNTQQTLTVHNHYALSWLKSCKPLDLPNTVGHLQHYHDLQPDAKNTEVILDENIERFRDPLMEKCTKVLKDLRLI